MYVVSATHFTAELQYKLSLCSPRKDLFIRIYVQLGQNVMPYTILNESIYISTVNTNENLFFLPMPSMWPADPSLLNVKHLPRSVLTGFNCLQICWWYEMTFLILIGPQISYVYLQLVIEWWCLIVNDPVSQITIGHERSLPLAWQAGVRSQLSVVVTCVQDLR